MKPPAPITCDKCPSAFGHIAGVARDDAVAVQQRLAEEHGWLRMARKGGRAEWRCPACKPSGVATPSGPGLSSRMPGGKA